MSEIKALEKLREIAADINASEIVDHMKLYPSCVFDGAWLDAWHDEFYRVIDMLELEIAERFVELPVDADGVPIHAGDMIEFGEKGERLEATHVGWTEHGDPTIAYRRPNGTLDCSCIGAECRHVKPRTVEDVLRECAERYASAADVEFGSTSEMFAMYEKEIYDITRKNPSGYGMKLTDDEIADAVRQLKEAARHADRDLTEGGNNTEYVKLPVDVYGVPMEIDDKLEYRDKSFVLKGLVWDGMDWYATDVFESTSWRPVNRCRHVKERTLEDLIAEYEELSVNQEVKNYFEVSNELRKIKSEQFKDEPELELYKEANGYEFYIELPYDELWIMTDKVEVKHHSYSYRYERPNGNTVMSCSSLCGYPREWAIERLDEAIEEIREQLGVDA